VQQQRVEMPRHSLFVSGLFMGLLFVRIRIRYSAYYSNRVDHEENIWCSINCVYTGIWSISRVWPLGDSVTLLFLERDWGIFAFGA